MAFPHRFAASHENITFCPDSPQGHKLHLWKHFAFSLIDSLGQALEMHQLQTSPGAGTLSSSALRTWLEWLTVVSLTTGTWVWVTPATASLCKYREGTGVALYEMALGSWLDVSWRSDNPEVLPKRFWTFLRFDHTLIFDFGLFFHF